MNKQKLIRKYEDACFAVVPVDEVLEDLKKLDEPQKVVVPQFIDEKIKYCKATDGYGLFHAMDYCYNFKECADWLESNEETFALAWIFGYEVEKEKRYEVILCNGQSLKTVYRQGSDYFDFEMVYGTPENFTKKQLEDAGFGWVFDCSGVEVQEVE